MSNMSNISNSIYADKCRTCRDSDILDLMILMKWNLLVTSLLYFSLSLSLDAYSFKLRLNLNFWRHKNIKNYLKVLLSYLKVCLTPITVHAVLSNSAVGDVCRYRRLTAGRVRFTHAHVSYLPHHHAIMTIIRV